MESDVLVVLRISICLPGGSIVAYRNVGEDFVNIYSFVFICSISLHRSCCSQQFYEFFERRAPLSVCMFVRLF